MKRFGWGLLAALGSLALAAPAFAGVEFQRLNGAFSLEDETQASDNGACLVAGFDQFRAFGFVSGTNGACTVSISYNAFVPNKASASVLKDDASGNAKISQQVQTNVSVNVSGAECATVFGASDFPDKCKVSASVDATEGFGSADTVEKGKVSLSCDLGENASELGGLTPEQIETVVGAFADRKDVKFSGSGKLTIKTKGVASGTNFCAA
jgi:hypothetical protein